MSVGGAAPPTPLSCAGPLTCWSRASVQPPPPPHTPHTPPTHTYTGHHPARQLYSGHLRLRSAVPGSEGAGAAPRAGHLPGKPPPSPAVACMCPPPSPSVACMCPPPLSTHTPTHPPLWRRPSTCGSPTSTPPRQFYCETTPGVRGAEEALAALSGGRGSACVLSLTLLPPTYPTLIPPTHPPMRQARCRT